MSDKNIKNRTLNERCITLLSNITSKWLGIKKKKKI
jgi:hypothetical protein